MKFRMTLVAEDLSEFVRHVTLADSLGFDVVAGDSLVVRARRPGDRFQPLGMADVKKLQDCLVDAKVPRLWRARIPLVCSERGVLWVVGWRIGERVKVTERTRRVRLLEFEPGRLAARPHADEAEDAVSGSIVG